MCFPPNERIVLAVNELFSATQKYGLRGFGENAVWTPQDRVETVLRMSGMVRNGTEFQTCKLIKNTASFVIEIYI